LSASAAAALALPPPLDAAVASAPELAAAGWLLPLSVEAELSHEECTSQPAKTNSTI
jgi:hypothetical protein